MRKGGRDGRDSYGYNEVESTFEHTHNGMQSIICILVCKLRFTCCTDQSAAFVCCCKVAECQCYCYRSLLVSDSQVRNKYAEQYDYEEISNLLGMEKSKKINFDVEVQKEYSGILPQL